jgi:hypothetical protein
MDRQITNIEQGTSKNEVPNSLSHRESGGERENAFHLFLGEVETLPSPLTLIRPPAPFSLREKESNGTRLAKRKTYSNLPTFCI